ncbi:6103_t:CDS:2 [Dentiscutata heterogama]|uniref:6103_t:CDS:1 n=1 Tax=Dentiscutata heterogama TaxID=1316150 RepID=A0ACA9K306_9GLOM|nr:6103_t:CDS:2 [Dentiscutata heterogama]
MPKKQKYNEESSAYSSKQHNYAERQKLSHKFNLVLNNRGNTINSIRDFTILDAYKLTEKAWENLTENTIKNCWKSTGILPNFLKNDGNSSTPKHLAGTPTNTKSISTHSEEDFQCFSI